MRVFRWIEWFINVKETTKLSLHSILVKVLYDISNVTNKWFVYKFDIHDLATKISNM